MSEDTNPYLDTISLMEETMLVGSGSKLIGPGQSQERINTLFVPEEPRSFADLGLSPTFVEHLCIKQIMAMPGSSGRDVAKALCLNPSLVLPVLSNLKRRLLVVHATAEVSGADFHFELSEAGRGFAQDIRKLNPYVGPAPVTLDAYEASVALQSLSEEKIGPANLKKAFSDLVVDSELLSLLGPAMASGKGVFLFGNSGNGKTSLAMRMSGAYRHCVYIPHAIMMEGQIIQLYDPQVHDAVDGHGDNEDPFRKRLDSRWVLCKRPTVIAGGELTLASLELQEDKETGVSEAPLQLKANCGLLVVDDFGRQQIDPAALLNRWILPLENRVDFLKLPNGRKVRVPFDPFLVFSTNLDPSDLVDEAFLRRIPYKVEVPDPSLGMFRKLLRREASAMGFQDDETAVSYLIRTVYTQPGRAMRCCHPRDLLLQIKNRCLYMGQPLQMTSEGIDLAAKGYFTLL